MLRLASQRAFQGQCRRIDKLVCGSNPGGRRFYARRVCRPVRPPHDSLYKDPGKATRSPNLRGLENVPEIEGVAALQDMLHSDPKEVMRRLKEVWRLSPPEALKRLRELEAEALQKAGKNRSREMPTNKEPDEVIEVEGTDGKGKVIFYNSELDLPEDYVMAGRTRGRQIRRQTIAAKRKTPE